MSRRLTGAQPPRVFSYEQQSTDKEPLDGGAPKLRWTHAPARGPTPEPPSPLAAMGGRRHSRSECRSKQKGEEEKKKRAGPAMGAAMEWP